jgi:hypothetical protein
MRRQVAGAVCLDFEWYRCRKALQSCTLQVQDFGPLEERSDVVAALKRRQRRGVSLGWNSPQETFQTLHGNGILVQAGLKCSGHACVDSYGAFAVLFGCHCAVVTVHSI